MLFLTCLFRRSCTDSIERKKKKKNIRPLAGAPVYEAVTRRRPTWERRRQRGLVPVRILVQSLLPAAGPVARGTLIERSPFTRRARLNGPFQVTVIYMQVITAGDDGWRRPIYLDYPQIKHVSEIPNVKNYYKVMGGGGFAIYLKFQMI